MKIDPDKRARLFQPMSNSILRVKSCTDIGVRTRDLNTDTEHTFDYRDLKRVEFPSDCFDLMFDNNFIDRGMFAKNLTKMRRGQSILTYLQDGHIEDLITFDNGESDEEGNQEEEDQVPVPDPEAEGDNVHRAVVDLPLQTVPGDPGVDLALQVDAGQADHQADVLLDDPHVHLRLPAALIPEPAAPARPQRDVDTAEQGRRPRRQRQTPSKFKDFVMKTEIEKKDKKKVSFNPQVVSHNMDQGVGLVKVGRERQVTA